MSFFSPGRIRAALTGVAAAIALLGGVPGQARADGAISQQQMQWEMQAGQQQFAQLAQQGKLLAQSPLYAVLNPVATRVAAVAQPQYFAQFRFILMNARSPNAMAVPGGNVYVTTAMLSFAQNQDELAGVLCHEVSHDIHHDVYDENHKNQSLVTMASVLGALLGSGGGIAAPLSQMAVGIGATAQAKSYSREAESAADRAGAYTCAQAGYNPYGMIWLFRRLAQRPAHAAGPESMEMLSDHPRDDHRVADLLDVFHRDPATFGRFTDDPAGAKPLPSPAPPMPGYGMPPQGLPPQGMPPQGMPPQAPPPR